MNTAKQAIQESCFIALFLLFNILYNLFTQLLQYETCLKVSGLNFSRLDFQSVFQVELTKNMFESGMHGCQTNT